METLVKTENAVNKFMESVKARTNNQPEFLQAVHEVAEVVIPYIKENPKYQNAKLYLFFHRGIYKPS